MSSIITAGTTRTQAGATQITADVTTVNTSTAVSGGTLVGDGVCLPQTGSGTDVVFLINNTANPIQLYGFKDPNGSYESINGISGSQGIAISPYSTAQLIEANPGVWQCGLDTSPAAAFNTNSTAVAATLTAANIAGGGSSVDLALTGTLTGAAAITLPTVAALVPSLFSPSVGTTYRLRIINESSGAFAWTVTTNTGWTLTGTMSIAQNTWREFVVTITGVGASPTATLQSVAVGTYS
jgi:hypothetical protein